MNSRYILLFQVSPGEVGDIDVLHSVVVDAYDLWIEKITFCLCKYFFNSM